MSSSNVLVYLLRRDLRVSDNPILHHLATTKDHGFTHLLPVYVFPAHQVEVSGFLRDGAESLYPEARSEVGGFWRCGPHRVKFAAESVWNLRQSLEGLGSGLTLRVGKHSDVVKHLIDGLAEKDHKVGAVWLTEEDAVEEKRDERSVSAVCKSHGVDFKTWPDEKYFIDDRDSKLKEPKDLPDVFTTYRKSVEPLREKPRATLPRPEKLALPAALDLEVIPDQQEPYAIPASYAELEEKLLRPLGDVLPNAPPHPENAQSVHPFHGGEDPALDRLQHLVMTDSVTNYKDTRNGLLGTDFSTKLSAYLALGCLTARQIHAEMLKFEDGTEASFKDVKGFGEGENEGSKAIRFELLWRDYMRLCTKKFKHKLFKLSGFRKNESDKWKSAGKDGKASPDQAKSPADFDRTLQRFLRGTTGLGLIDASQRELLHTGYTSNRARQNVASFLTKHLGIDWRYGAEWYEMMLVDYDVSSNWSNWQYVAGVGNDPRGEARIFNPIKQAFDYDKEGNYVRSWVPELGQLERLENLFQAWTTPAEDWERLGIAGLQMVTDPIMRIEFTVEARPKNSRRTYPGRRGKGRGGNGGARGGPRGGGSGGGSPTGQSSSGHTSPGQDGNAQVPVANGMSTGPWVQRQSPPGGHPRGNGGYRNGYQGHPNGNGNYFGNGNGNHFGNGGGFRGGRGGGGGAGQGYRGRGGYGGGRAAYRGRGGFYQSNYQPTETRPQWTTTNPVVPT